MYPDDVKSALDAFRVLREAWEAVRNTGTLSPDVRADLVKKVGLAREAAVRADPHVVNARSLLHDPENYQARSRTCDLLAPKSWRSESTRHWKLEQAVLKDHVPIGTLDSYLRAAKRDIFRPSRLHKLPSPPPFISEKPISDQSTMLSVPTRDDWASRRVQSQLKIIDSIIIILANTFNDTTRLRFDASYTLGMSVAVSA